MSETNQLVESTEGQVHLTVPIVPCARFPDLYASLLAAGPEAAAQGWWHRRHELASALPATALTALRESVETHVRRGGGAVVVRLGADMPVDAVRLAQLVLGETFGRVLTIAPDEPGRPLFQISAVEGAGKTGAYTGNGKNRNAIGLHTDGSGVLPPTEIMSLACLCPAWRGGESRLADARLVYANLGEETRSVLELPQPRESPYGTAAPIVAPVFDRSTGGAFSYHPARVRNGIISVRGTLANTERAALDELDRRLDEHAVEFRLERGDILILDNRRIAHDRRAFEDDPAAPRLLERLWIGFND